MMPLRKPTASNAPAPVRETFTWPPSTDELDAIEVIVLDRQPAPKRRRADLAHWGLTLTSLTAIVVALVLQFADWRGTPPTAPSAASPPAASASDDRTAALAMATPAVVEPAAGLAPLTRAVTAPPTRRAISRAAPAFVPVRKARQRQDHRSPTSSAALPRSTTIDSPPLRLPESYVQPRFVSSGDSRRVRGQVVLGVHVHANGRVGAVNVLSERDDVEDRDLERAAVAAVKQWRYRPALRDGVPTSARLKVIVKFS